jgi:Cu+-exporting ATPase
MKNISGLMTVFVFIFLLAVPSVSSSDDMKISTIPLTVKGMVCGQCERPVKRALKRLDGVTGVKLKRDRAKREGDVVVTYDPSKVTPEQVIDAVNKTGFKAELKKE